MTGDGGLIALTLEDANRLLQWPPRSTTSWTADDESLWQRLHEWRDRHVEMAKRLAEIDSYIARHSEATP